ncbi:OLC1v1005610C1 [Oldenlandia corymbosa var. corymbosa]|uniref:OLC1v1005610C1 n=1 Tax=Oldenlandia corymbosa var. corymbosa TaxID=529605 RepID=A0AAV1DF12_OLDCO|nr:OLC1v1005610C1 [Oldenlandia corymbosa var. corymbosa]
MTVCEVGSAGSEGCHPDDLKALNDFKAGITYDESQRLKRWIGVNCCKWVGISCDDITGRVTEINLPGALTKNGAQLRMKGELSPSLHLLSSLRVLHLGGLSQLSGQIPPLIGDLKDLQFWDLHKEQL